MAFDTTLLRCEAQRSLAAGSIGASYTAVGTGFNHQIASATFFNATDGYVQLSYDGIVDHFVLAPGMPFVFDAYSNALLYSVGTILYAKRVSGLANPTTGSVFVQNIVYASFN